MTCESLYPVAAESVLTALLCLKLFKGSIAEFKFIDFEMHSKYCI